jgi:type II secretion system protein H
MKASFCPARRHPAFTLIELMIVIAIMGLIAAMGMPSIIKAIQKEGMRKAVSDVMDCCAAARARAIIHQVPASVTFHPQDRTFSVDGGSPGHGSTYVTKSQLPDGVDFTMLDINWQDYSQSDPARVWFYPNGTSDEMTIVLHDRHQDRKLTLEFSTGSLRISDVDK